MVIPDTLGRRSGSNLFHSFDRFEVLPDQSARFRRVTEPASPDDRIGRIIARVTGPEPAKILGSLASDIPSADLYMISPQGIVIGPKASISVDGAFHASTANSVRFKDGSTFVAARGLDGVLSVSPPESFGFIGRSASISIAAGAVSAQRDVNLFAGDVRLNQAKVESLNAGRVRIVAVGEAGGSVPLDGPAADPGRYGGTLSVDRGSIGAGRGSIRLEAGALSIAGANVEVTSDAFGGAGGVDVSAATIHISQSGSGVGQLRSGTRGSESSGPIRIRAGNLTLDGGRISAETIATGTGAPISVEVAGTLLVSGGGTITTNSNGPGDAGRIDVSAGSIRLQERGSIGGVAYGSGRGAAVNVTAREALTIVGETPLDSPLATQSGLFALSRASGDAGNVTVEAGTLSLAHFGEIGSGGFGTGAGGSVLVTAGSISIADSGVIGASAGPQAARGGSVTIRTDAMRLTDAGEVAVRSQSPGPAGDLRIVMSGPLTLDTSALTARAERSSGGSIAIESPGLVRIAKSQVTASAGGMGGGGNVTIGARNLVLDRSAVTATAVGGNGGAVRFASTTYHASPDSLVSVSSQFGLDGTVRNDVPLFGRLAPSGDADPAKPIPAMPLLANCEAGSRAGPAATPDPLSISRPLTAPRTRFQLPGERATQSAARRSIVGCSFTMDQG